MICPAIHLLSIQQAQDYKIASHSRLILAQHMTCFIDISKIESPNKSVYLFKHTLAVLGARFELLESAACNRLLTWAIGCSTKTSFGLLLPLKCLRCCKNSVKFSTSNFSTSSLACNQTARECKLQSARTIRVRCALSCLFQKLRAAS